MKIGPIENKAPVAPLGNEARPAAAPAGPAAAAGTAEASAQVELSSAASSLLAGGVAGEFDAEKVARIAQAIRDGSFKIDAEVIADKLIANAQELLDKPSA